NIVNTGSKGGYKGLYFNGITVKEVEVQTTAVAAMFSLARTAVYMTDNTTVRSFTHRRIAKRL
ncbi:MAG: hypothetical protein IIU90_00250, partial [Bacteroidaceae bacterium]|nr:hypothetical protein [Bacteroidaceae bacterium]